MQRRWTAARLRRDALSVHERRAGADGHPSRRPRLSAERFEVDRDVLPASRAASLNRLWCMQRIAHALIVCLLAAGTAYAFLEDICLPRRPGQGALSYCVRPNCPGNDPNRSCPAQLIDFA